MTQEFLANLWYYILALVWAVYIFQELYISGSAMLSIAYDVESVKFKNINSSVGAHWDGIQVWLIVAIGGLFAVFYDAYALLFESLYIPVFLLLYTIIFRGTAIELIYKFNTHKARKVVAIIWAVASLLLITVLGLYLSNLFIGLPIKDEKMTESFLAIFNNVALFGTAFFVITALSFGYSWIKITCGDDYFDKYDGVFRWFSVASIITLVIILLALNQQTPGFSEGLFIDYPLLWILPAVALLSGLISCTLTLKKFYKLGLLFGIIMVICFIFTGFSLTFPYIVYSTIDVSQGLTIIDAAASKYSLTLMTVATLIFVPIVIAYQTWKYIKFWKR